MTDSCEEELEATMLTPMGNKDTTNFVEY
jgi:hypothetical protein